MIFKQNKTINYYFTIFLLFSLIFIKFINSGVHTVPETDEIVSITTFTDIRTLFLKYIPNNHFFSSLFGTLLTNIFGLNLIILRSVSYLFIFFSFIYICKKNENISKTLIILLLFLLNPLVIDYSFLYRGYAFSTFLFVLLFYQITIIYKNDQSSKIALLILSFLIFHSLSNIYVVVPTLLLIIFFLYKNKKLSNLKFFFYSMYNFIFYIDCYYGNLFKQRSNYNRRVEFFFNYSKLF